MFSSFLEGEGVTDCHCIGDEVSARRYCCGNISVQKYYVVLRVVLDHAWL